ncbi:MAG: hypothetical protein ACI9SB_001647 [Candidatus Azotimanducaceae bacterium]
MKSIAQLYLYADLVSHRRQYTFGGTSVVAVAKIDERYFQYTRTLINRHGNCFTFEGGGLQPITVIRMALYTENFKGVNVIKVFAVSEKIRILVCTMRRRERLEPCHPVRATIILPARFALLLVLAAVNGQAMAQASDLITFEPLGGYLPNGTLAADNMAINTQYRAQYGVSFGVDSDSNLEIDSGSSLRLEDTANSSGIWGYVSTNADQQYNNAASGFESQLGGWFLTNNGLNLYEDLLIQYDNPVNDASGEIWDLDGRNNGNYERWKISAYDDSNNLVGSVETPLGLHNTVEGSLDSKPWVWSFDTAGAPQIMKIALAFTGTTGVSPLGFNNFATSTASVGTPEPQFWAMLSCFGFISFFAYRKRQA